MLPKEKVHQHFSDLLNAKIESLQNVLDDLKASAANETKSTAGDKHETALAMLQIEQANKRAQLQELLTQKAILQKINPQVTTVQVVPGSLIKTNQGFYFLSVALGKANISGVQVIALSAQSPLGAVLMGCKKADTVSFNNVSLLIEEIF